MVLLDFCFVKTKKICKFGVCRSVGEQRWEMVCKSIRKSGVPWCGQRVSGNWTIHIRTTLMDACNFDPRSGIDSETVV